MTWFGSVEPASPRCCLSNDQVESGRLLRLIIRLNIVVTWIAAAFILALNSYVVSSPWLMVIFGGLVGLSVCLVGADVLLSRGRVAASIVLLAVANWAAEIAATGLVPLAQTILPIVVLLPALAAVPYLSSRQLRAIFGAAILVELAVCIAGRLHAGVGLEARTPEWIQDTFAIIFIPITATVVILVAWQNHTVLAAEVDELELSRKRLMTAADRERHRIERELNNGALRSTRVIRKRLLTAQRLTSAHDPGASRVLGDIADTLQQASGELRAIAHGIYPPQLVEHGLEAAVRSSASVAPLPTTVLAVDMRRFAPATEAVAYFCCIEAIRGADRHGPDSAAITIELDGGDGLRFTVEDGSRPNEDALWRARDSLTGMADRIHAVGGRCAFESAAGRGIRLHGYIPDPPSGGAAPGMWTRVKDAALSVLAGVWSVVSRIVGRIELTRADQHISAGIQAQLVPSLGTVVFILGIFALFVRNAWLLLLALVTLAAAGLFYVARKASDRTDYRLALAVATPTIWTYSLVVVAIFPTGLSHSSILVAGPVVLAIPYVSRLFRTCMAGTIIFAIAVAATGRLSPGVGLEQQAPKWLVDTELAIITTVNSTILLVVAYVSYVALAMRTAQLQESRTRVVAAADRERRAIERNLHDGAQQRLVAAAIQTRIAQGLVAARPGRAAGLLHDLAEDLDHADTELRDLALGIFPAGLAEHGLATALRTVASRSPIPTSVRAEGFGRYDPLIELNLYYLCLEGVQNAIKHAGGSATLMIRLTASDRGPIEVEVRDDGRGCDLSTVVSGFGYASLTDRLAMIGGEVDVQAGPGSGVRLCARISQPGQLDVAVGPGGNRV